MLRGGGFMIMWHDIAPEGEQEYHHWHSKQHMPERLGHPGFLRSRRGVNWALDWQRYFTLYEGEMLETFVSEDYRRSLDGPTEWTTRMAPHFRNFLRCACAVAYTSGRGVGGALVTLRGRRPEGMSEADFHDAAIPVLEGLGQQPLVSGVHLGLARPEFSNMPTKETELRPAMNEAPFDYVVILESFGIRELESLHVSLTEALAAMGCGDVVTQNYDMAYTIEKE